MGDTASGELSVDDLARRCQHESEQYLAGQAHDETYCLELFHRVILTDDQEAWRAIYAQYQNLVADWVWQHSKFQSIQEETIVLVNTAFARFWHTVSTQSEGAKSQFDSLGKLLQYLKSCVHSAIEDMHRQQQRWPPEALIWNELAEALVDEAPSPEARVLSRLAQEALEWAVWSRLRGEAEVVVATFSWQYGLSPKEIQARRPDLFATVQQVYQIKRNILDRLTRDPDIQKLRQQIR